MKVQPSQQRLDSGGNYVAGDYAKLYYVQANIDVTGGWEDLRNYIDLALEAALPDGRRVAHRASRSGWPDACAAAWYAHTSALPRVAPPDQ